MQYSRITTHRNSALQMKMWGEMLCYQPGTICQCVSYEEQTLTGPAGQRHRAQVINMPRLMSSPSIAFATLPL